MRRFATGLDTPGAGTNEAQRADSAPRVTSGDGIINSSDVIQARRYATGLDPLTDAGGPAGPSPVSEGIAEVINDAYAYFFGREIRVGEVKAVNGESVTVPVEMTVFGDEVALSFTLEYAGTQLVNPRLVLDEGVPETAVMTINANDDGRIGILIDSTEAMTASAMPKRIIMVTFDILPGARGEIPILVTGTLASRGTSDAAGNMLSTRYAGGLVRILSKE